MVASARVNGVPQQDHRHLRFTQADYATFVESVQTSHVLLPGQFRMPSRHALSRYLEGFSSGVSKHLPFLHLPSTRISKVPLDLMLAMVSIGAQYRYERQPAVELYKAAKAAVEFNTRGMGSDVTFTPLKATQGVSSPISSSTATSLSNLGGNAEVGAVPKDPGVAGVKFTTVQAMLMLVTFCTWNHKSMLRDGYTIATEVASILREDTHLCSKRHDANPTWERWIEVESHRRTVLVAFWLMNLASVVHHSPPRLLNRDIFPVHLPSSEEEWKAGSLEEWAAIRSGSQDKDTSFGEVYTMLFSDEESRRPALEVSSFGNLTLIYSIFQRLYLAWESSAAYTTDAFAKEETTLPAEVVRKFETALRRWQVSWESTRESSLQPISPSGTLGFNATALYRITHIRLYLNLGPHRRLETRDPLAIARAFYQAPLPAQTSQVYRALVQAIHSLSIPVRVGLDYVIRTQTIDWSLLHAVCNLECAILLSKWLQGIGHEPRRLSDTELRLLKSIARVLEEAQLLDATAMVHGQPDPMQLAVLVIRLAAAVFKGDHAWELWASLHAGLEAYTSIIEPGQNRTSDIQ